MTKTRRPEMLLQNMIGAHREIGGLIPAQGITRVENLGLQTVFDVRVHADLGIGRARAGFLAALPITLKTSIAG
jgi:hypothetical protein